MSKNRLEAFSDAVIAIIITIMVLALEPPSGTSLGDLGPLLPKLGSYALSFLFLGIYWNNHHHLFQTVERVNGTILWANLHLLFWLSLIPFVTGWMGESHFASWPVALYGLDLLLDATAYSILTLALVAEHGRSSTLARALGSDVKGRGSVVAYLISLPLAFVSPGLACALFVAVALWWLVPDRRMERAIAGR
ncbi:MAG TPA: TMEM175 family protein [Candidatus Limnocylindrales bacterium]|nr:TMEM175 family protein [Candidatus Limnocylindrales bacterium]